MTRFSSTRLKPSPTIQPKTTQPNTMQPIPEQLKPDAAKAAIRYIEPQLTVNTILGIGTGSTANAFIEQLALFKHRFKGAVASSEASKSLLKAQGIKTYDLNSVIELPFYIDGADEVSPQLAVIKGGGGALTREKITVACSRTFICIIDHTKEVDILGGFPLPIEIIPMARTYVCRELVKLGGDPLERPGFITDNGHQILDVYGLTITDPWTLEAELNQITGIVTNGLFAIRGPDVLISAHPEGVRLRNAIDSADDQP